MKTDQVLEEIKRIGIDYGVGQLILFGSRASGNPGERSDFDIAVSQISRFDEFKEEIEEIPALYSFDVINIDTCGNKLLREEILKNGQKII